MFLFFMIVLGCGVGLYKLIGDWHTEKKRKRRAIDEGRRFYIDRYGFSVDVKTDVPYRIVGSRLTSKGYTDSVKVTKGGSVIHNYTQDIRDQIAEDRKISKQKAIQNGEQYYVYEKSHNTWPGGMNASLFEFQVNSKQFRHVLWHTDVIWADVRDDIPFFICRIKVFSPYTSANIKVSIPDGKVIGIIDENLYTKEELIAINKEINKVCNRCSSLQSWKHQTLLDGFHGVHVKER